MPAICNYSDRHERATLIEEWLQSVCFRDLMQLRGARYEGSVARDLLELIAKNPELSRADLARQLGLDSRVIGKYLVGLAALHVLHRIRPYRVRRGAGSDRFYLFDAAVAEYLGASKNMHRPSTAAHAR